MEESECITEQRTTGLGTRRGSKAGDSQRALEGSPSRGRDTGRRPQWKLETSVFSTNESSVNITSILTELAQGKSILTVWGTFQASGEFTVSPPDGITVPRPQGSYRSLSPPDA